MRLLSSFISFGLLAVALSACASRDGFYTEGSHTTYYSNVEPTVPAAPPGQYYSAQTPPPPGASANYYSNVQAQPAPSGYNSAQTPPPPQPVGYYSHMRPNPAAAQQPAPAVANSGYSSTTTQPVAAPVTSNVIPAGRIVSVKRVEQPTVITTSTATPSSAVSQVPDVR